MTVEQRKVVIFIKRKEKSNEKNKNIFFYNKNFLLKILLFNLHKNNL
jgi:hypothetical protein